MIGATEDEDPGVRSTALFQLARGLIEADALRPLIVRRLGDPDPGMRMSAIGKLGDLSPVRESGWSIGALVERVGDEDERVAESAIEGLGRSSREAFLGASRPSGRSLGEWVAEATAGERRGRARAILAMGPFGVEALGPLGRLAIDPDPAIRRLALIVLGQVGPESLPIVLERLGDPDPLVRLEALRASRWLGAGAAAMVARSLDDPDRSLRWMAADSLEALGAEARSVVPELVASLRRPDDDAAFKSAFALASVGAGDPAVIPALIEALGAADSSLHGAAARILSGLGSEAVVAILPLLRRGGRDGWRHAQELIHSAKDAAPGEVAAALREALGDEDRDVRWVAAETLGDPAFRPHGAVELLVSACRDPDPFVRRGAVWTLDAIGEEAAPAAPVLLDLLISDDWVYSSLSLRRDAARALKQIGADPSAALPALPALLALLDSPDPRIRLDAAWSLSVLAPGLAAGIPALIGCLTSAVSSDRRCACHALENLGPGAAEAIPALEGLLDGPDRDAAADALERIGRATTT